MEKISTGSVTVTPMSTPGAAPYKNPGDVSFEVKYPKDYKGVKHMPEGVTVVSKETAEQFEKLGIGKVATEDAPAKEESKAKEGKSK